MGSPWSSASAGCNRVHSAPLPDFVFASRSFADLFATCPAMISEFHSARSPRLSFGSRLRSINYFASLVHSAELMNVEPKAVLGFLSFSIVFIEIPFKALANRQYIFIEKIASDLHVKSRFTFVSSVDAVRASRQPNMEGNFLIALRAALDFARKKLRRGVRWASGLSRSGHRPLTIYENRRKFSRALLRAAKGSDCRSLWGELLNPRRGRGEGRRRAYIEEEGEEFLTRNCELSFTDPRDARYCVTNCRRNHLTWVGLKTGLFLTFSFLRLIRVSRFGGVDSCLAVPPFARRNSNWLRNILMISRKMRADRANGMPSEGVCSLVMSVGFQNFQNLQVICSKNFNSWQRSALKNIFLWLNWQSNPSTMKQFRSSAFLRKFLTLYGSRRVFCSIKAFSHAKRLQSVHWLMSKAKCWWSNSTLSGRRKRRRPAIGSAKEFWLIIHQHTKASLVSSSPK